MTEDGFIHEKFKSDIKIYESITNCQKAARVILENVVSFIERYPLSDVIIEYPALATKSGAYLAILHGYLASYLNENVIVNSVTYVPPTAVDSFTKNREHSKTFLVNYCKEKGYIEKKASHDECTAIILCKLLEAISQGKYKNSYFKYEGIY